MGMPYTVEDLYMKNFEYADLVAYPISPTIAYPSTYPMLDPNPEDCDMPEIRKSQVSCFEFDYATYIVCCSTHDLSE